MSTTRLIGLLAVLGSLAVPAAAGAQATVEDRFEVVAEADFRSIQEDCGDGTTASTRVFIEGGHEEERLNGRTTTDGDRVRIGISSGCTGETIQGQSNDAVFTFSPNLQTARVVGTVVTEDGHTVEVDITWTEDGPLESEAGTNAFPGRVSHSVVRERDATATGTVVLDGRTLVDGQVTSNAELVSFDDRTISTPAGDE
jgi:hypothetical protein